MTFDIKRKPNVVCVWIVLIITATTKILIKTSFWLWSVYYKLTLFVGRDGIVLYPVMQSRLRVERRKDAVEVGGVQMLHSRHQPPDLRHCQANLRWALLQVVWVVIHLQVLLQDFVLLVWWWIHSSELLRCRGLICQELAVSIRPVLVELSK